MDLPSLRHFRNEGIFTVSSDPVEALVGEAWVPAVYTDKGWATADGASLLQDVTEWRNASKKRKQQKNNPTEHQDGDQQGPTIIYGRGYRVLKSR
jgi:hypothetical protein